MARTAGSLYQHDWNDDTWTAGTPTTAIETLIGTTESLTGAIDCRTFWSVQLSWEINYDPTPTDRVGINIYGSPDGTNWDNTPINNVFGDNSTDPERQTLVVNNPPAYVRVGFVQSGSTNSHDINAVRYIGYN